LLCVGAFIAWHFIPKQTPGADPGFRRDPRIGADNPDWRAAVEEHCESPAESAFLKVMIEAHQLQPRDGSLHGNGLQLDLQVKQSNYRVDFLVNGWLVVEIDGAAWHSSPEQQSRDAVRDEHFTGLGYAVIRIPAKTVFQRPDDAMRAVKARLQFGKPQLSESVQQGGLERLADTMRGISAGMSEINDSLYRARAIQDPRLRPIAMRMLIDLNCVLVAERLHGKERTQLRKIDRTSEWHEILIYGSIQPIIYDLLINGNGVRLPE
jgi:very-short-patch-repair endonuclease